MPGAHAEKPNIVLILADDMGAWAMGCAGNPEVRTPNLDRLAASGIRFSNFFCASPVCSPARASLLTGRIPSQHGIHDWLRLGNSDLETGFKNRAPCAIEYLEGLSGYTDVLAAHGYGCGFSGKWHLGDTRRPQKGFTFWRPLAREGGYYPTEFMRDGEVVSDPGYSTDVVTDNALEFLEERGRDNRPFYLSVHTFAPHGPWDRSCHPPDLWDDYFERCPFRSTPELPMHPWQINSCDWAAGEARRKLLAGYFAAITTVDANVGRLVNRLERLGLRANTLVLFTGDNGMNMGHHGIFGKGNGTFPQNMFEESVKVPAILSCPGRVPAGAVCDELLSHYDVRPTLLELAGIADAEAGGLPGRSFAPILRGEAAPPREPVVVFDEYGPVRMIRDRRWKYVHRYPYGPHELYDLAADPGEEANLIGRDDAGEVAARLKARLDAWFVRYADPARDGVREGVTGKGQLGPAGPAGQGTLTHGDDWHYLGERSA